MPKSTEDILKAAILLELRGKAFYTKTARESGSEAVRKIFTKLAEEEDAHVEFLSKQFAEYKKSGRFAKNPLLYKLDEELREQIWYDNNFWPF
jgi:rubrerythrin